MLVCVCVFDAVWVGGGGGYLSALLQSKNDVCIRNFELNFRLKIAVFIRKISDFDDKNTVLTHQHNTKFKVQPF